MRWNGANGSRLDGVVLLKLNALATEKTKHCLLHDIHIQTELIYLSNYVILYYLCPLDFGSLPWNSNNAKILSIRRNALSRCALRIQCMHASGEKSLAVYSSTYKCVWFVYETLIALLSNAPPEWFMGDKHRTIEGWQWQEEKLPVSTCIIVAMKRCTVYALRTADAMKMDSVTLRGQKQWHGTWFNPCSAGYWFF